MSGSDAFIIAARRTANGRVGGLHRNRRIEDLAAPVVGELLADANLAARRVDLIAVGNTTAGSNPARLIGLVAGLPDRAIALTIDREEVSGLDAVLTAIRSIRAGDAEIAVAGGAEALSMAPWRITKPRNLYQTPRFMGLGQADAAAPAGAAIVEAANALAQHLGLARNRLDELALATHIKAGLARDGRRLIKEIVALKTSADETRDEPVLDLEIDDLEAMPTLAGDGTATAGNVSPIADGAAFAAIVSETVWKELGRPAALRVVASASLGVAGDRTVEAPIEAARQLAGRPGFAGFEGLARIELGESSAVQVIVFRDTLGLNDEMINRDGGQLARGMPIGAAGAVLIVRLFSGLVRGADKDRGAGRQAGLVVIGSASGQATAALLEQAGG